ncbi:DUF2158 domain-containing protein [Paracoccus gahaiensis]|uniref:DUF2158 domain-containing protein n=1 Tax=Paracoccus gahaiensis TaxID=1706839 RepID=A0A4U0R4A3_9RHOB|nr:DUF2158 domain-containing protein [Paracoccus gahaiensis]TJZ89012.1 DUF2158 domain-containing protein [Paracoccus gahaiensis]
MEKTFQVGDTVRLKSGGPVMTYEGAGAYSGAICSWFDGGKLVREGFTLATLEAAPLAR